MIFYIEPRGDKMKTNCQPNTVVCFKTALKFFAILMLALLVASCGSKKNIQKTPPFNFGGTTFSKRIDSGSGLGVPSQVTDQFSVNDKEVYAHLKLENVSGAHKVRWEWYDPSGRLYYATDNTTVKASRGNYLKKCTAWHKLTIFGDKAQEMPGEWELKVFYDNDMMETKKFSILAEKAIMASTALPSTQRIFPKDWGLIIGIEDYSHLPRVDYARKDALVIREYFNKILGVPEENIISLIDSDATKARINGYLKKYIPNNVSKDTTLYVYFAGHGVPDMQKGEPYLVPYDGDTLFIEETGYKLKDFYKAIYDLEVNQAYVFLDSCFSGVASRAAEMLTKGARPALLNVEDVGLATQEVISISAATSSQTSNPLPKEEHGLFTYYLLRALKGKADENEDRFVTIKEIYQYVNKQVTRAARRMGREQTPVISPSLEDIKDISVSRVSQ
jgi:caspase domain-containing protein